MHQCKCAILIIGQGTGLVIPRTGLNITNASLMPLGHRARFLAQFLGLNTIIVSHFELSRLVNVENVNVINQNEI